MDIYKYKEDVMSKLKDMNDEDFVDLLQKAGVNCKLVKKDNYVVKSKKSSKSNKYLLDQKNYIYIDKDKQYEKTIASHSYQEKMNKKDASLEGFKYNYKVATNDSFNNWSEAAA